MRTLIIFIITILSLNINAQELTVKSFSHAQNDISAQSSSRKDLNSKNCALVKVGIALPNVRFEGNVMGDVEHKTSEYWVYMPQGSSMLKVSHSDFMPLMVNFAEHNVGKLESGCTYYLMIAVPQKGDVPNQKQMLNISFSPQNASVIIDNEIVEANNGKVSISLPVGKHDFLITAKGYESEDGTINLKSSAPSKLNIELAKKNSGSTPSSASASSSRDPYYDPFGSNDYELTIVKNTLGAELREVNKQEKENLDIKYGLRVISVNDGKLKESGMPVNFFILSINDTPMKSISDLSAVIKSAQKSKDPVLIMKGCTPSGTIKYFKVPLNQDNNQSSNVRQSNTQNIPVRNISSYTFISGSQQPCTYLLVCASFGLKLNAEALARKLEEKGYQSIVILDNNSSMYRIAAYTSNDLSEVAMFKERIKKDYRDTWIGKLQ